MSVSGAYLHKKLAVPRNLATAALAHNSRDEDLPETKWL